MAWEAGENTNTVEIWNQVLQKSAAYIIRKNGSYYESLSGSSGKLVYGGSGNAGGATGTDAATVIQETLTNGLTGGRSQKERVLCVGDFTTDATITIPAYTILELDGKITWNGADSLASNILHSTASHTELVGGCYDGGNTAGCVYYHDGMGTASDFKIHDTYMTNIKQMGAFATIWNIVNGIISNNYIYGNEKGLGFNLFDGCRNVAVSSNVFNLTYDSAVSIGSSGGGILCSDIAVTGNTAIGYPAGNGMGISVFGKASHITITGNTIKDQHFDGINAITDGNTPDNICASGNVIDGCLRHGITIQSTNSLASGNIIRDNGDHGIWVSGDSAVLNGNLIRGCTNCGIYLYPDTDYCVITGNTSQYNDYGIVISADCDKTLVVGNNLLNNTTANLTDNGTDTVDEHNIKA